jgi:hypothetical protein
MGVTERRDPHVSHCREYERVRKGAAKVLQECYTVVTKMLQRCHTDVARCCKSVTRTSRGCYLKEIQARHTVACEGRLDRPEASVVREGRRRVEGGTGEGARRGDHESREECEQREG